MRGLRQIDLPVAAPRAVLATGAFLKNSACLVAGRRAWLSNVHGDLDGPDARIALENSVRQMLRLSGVVPEVIAHDLHPDFFSTTLANALAAEFDVPALGVQHHHAHVAVVQAEKGWVDEPVIGLAFDGIGLGTDGHSWGGEVLRVQAGRFERCAHLPWLRLPGGDRAAREPWRAAAGLLHSLGRTDEVVRRFCPPIETVVVEGVLQMLARDTLCPLSSGGGRWFDAVSAILGLWSGTQEEAQAACALEQAATRWWSRGSDRDSAGVLETLPLPPVRDAGVDLVALVDSLCAEPDSERGAARFHEALVRWMVESVIAIPDVRAVALGGGCFLNARLRETVTQRLARLGFTVCSPQHVSTGDAGLSLGQAWAASVASVPLHRLSREIALEV